MLVTRQTKIPLLWLFMITIPWVVFYIGMLTGGLSFLILNRLIDNPAALTFIVSLPGLIFTFVPVGSYITYMSDRVWTRWGRRKIFLIVWSGGGALVAFLYPLAPTVSIFLAIMFLGAVCSLFGGPFEALKLEIVPSDMRGRSSAMGSWVSTSINIVYYAMVFGCFNEVLPIWGHHANGVSLIYWSVATAFGILTYFYLFGVHEVKPTSVLTGEKFSLKKAWQAMAMPQLRYLYVFVIATAMVNASLGSLNILLYINQWGYTTQEFGRCVAIGGVINLCLIPLIGIFADKGKNHRMGIWVTCIVIVKVLTLSTFLYYTCYLPDQRPTLVEIVVFGEMTSIFGLIAGMIYYPLVYDYVPRNLMGTYCAGAGILSSITNYCTINGLGLFLAAWGALYQPPAGEMARVCLKREMSQPEVARVLQTAGLRTPSGGQAASRDIVANPWYANGVVIDHGFCYEIRLRDKDAERKMKRRDELKTKGDALEVTIQAKRDNGASSNDLAGRQKELTSLRAEQTSLNAELSSRTEAWRREVLRGLDALVMKEGSEILSHATASAVVTQIPTTHKPTPAMVDRINKRLRAADPSAIGLGVVCVDRCFAFSAAALLPAGQDAQAAARSLGQRVADLANTAVPGLVALPLAPIPTVVKPALITEVALVENPMRLFVSPITRVANRVLSWFTEVSPPDQKLHSLADSLCKDGPIRHARADALPDRNGVRLTIVGAGATPADMTTWTPQIQDKVRKACDSLTLTVPSPVIGGDVLPMKYNYMSGYLFIFVLVVVGLSLVAYFIRKEKAGIVRKWGAEESHAARQEAEKKELATAAAAEDPSVAAAPEALATYTPGYLAPKVALALLGLVVLVSGGFQAWPGLRLLAVGQRTEAVVQSVVACKPGQSDVVLCSQAELDAHQKGVANAKDYAWTYYDNFSFETTGGQEVTFHRDVGSKLKPPMALLDADGLPVTATVLYDHAQPSRAILPLEHDTWLVPILTGFLGMLMFIVGTVFAWFARKPITLSGVADVNLIAGGKGS